MEGRVRRACLPSCPRALSGSTHLLASTGRAARIPLELKRARHATPKCHSRAPRRRRYPLVGRDHGRHKPFPQESPRGRSGPALTVPEAGPRSVPAQPAPRKPFLQGLQQRPTVRISLFGGPDRTLQDPRKTQTAVRTAAPADLPWPLPEATSPYETAPCRTPSDLPKPRPPNRKTRRPSALRPRPPKPRCRTRSRPACRDRCARP